MPLEALTKQMIIDAKLEAKRIVDGAQKKAAETVREAEKQRKQLLSAIENSAKKQALSEKTEAIAATRLEAKRIIEEAKEEKIEQAIVTVWKEFSKQREAKNYKKILKSLIENGLKTIGEKAVIMVNEKDTAIAKEFSRKIRIKKAEISAGAIIASADEKIVVNNSFEAIFEERKEAIKAKLFEKIFVERKK